MYNLYLLLFINSEPSAPRHPCIIGDDTDGIELNWIPPLQPNGDVHYLIQYKNDGNTTASVNTLSESTYYNLTGLQRGVTYNITVVAVNSAGRSDTGAVLNYTHNPQSKYLSINDISNCELSWYKFTKSIIWNIAKQHMCTLVLTQLRVVAKVLHFSNGAGG